MTTTSKLTTVRTADSSDRTLVLTRTGAPAHAVPPTASRISGAARRVLDALMRSLAAPHI
jgi:hypothetical protein